MTPICTICIQRGHPCPWHRRDAIAFTRNYWHEHVAVTGHQVPEDTNGLQLHSARYADYVRERNRRRYEQEAA